MEMVKLFYNFKNPYILKFAIFKGRNNLEIKYPVKSPATLRQSLSWTLLSYKTKYVQYMPGTNYKHVLCY